MDSLRNVPNVVSIAVTNIKVIPIICVCVLIYCLVTSLAPAPYGVLEPSSIVPCVEGLSWCICPRVAVCATSIREMVFLVIARGSIYTVYPYIMLLFLTKARHVTAYLQRNIYSIYFNFEDTHHMHRLGGTIVEITTWIHVLFHLIRWGIRGDIGLLTSHITGQTGLIAIIVMPLITWPMQFKFIRDRLTYEYRKSMHYLSWVWGLAMVFHAPAVNIFWIMGSACLVYFIDWLLSAHRSTHLVESTIFRKLGSSTLLSFENPQGFKLEGASYVLVLLPWLSKTQWHAFSVFPHPTMENTSSVCMSAAGDWTRKLHQLIERPTARPAWICGPFLSPFSTALNYDHIITIASGIGITPALAVLDRYKNQRRINLIWSCRDASLIEFFVNMVKFPEDAYIFIFYTGKTPLSLGNDAPPNVLVFKGRPNLDKVIVGMIYRIETHFLLPEEIVEEGHLFRDLSTEEKGQYLLSRIAFDYDALEFYEAAAIELPKDVLVKETSKRRSFASETTFESVNEGGKNVSFAFPKQQRRGSLLVSNLAGAKTKDFKRRGSTNVERAVSTRFLGVNPSQDNTSGSRRKSIASALSSRSGASKLCMYKNILSERKIQFAMGVTSESFSNAVQDFFGNIMYTEEEVLDVFKSIDKKNQGYITEEDFLLFFDEFELEMQQYTVTDEEDGKKHISWIDKSHEEHQEDHEHNNDHHHSYMLDIDASVKGKHFRKSEFITAKGKKGGKKSKQEIEDEKRYEEQRTFVKDHQDAVKTWEMLYCGGSAPIVSQLKHISHEYDIDLKIEKFDW